MLTVDEIRALMADRKVTKVASEIGVHAQTIYTLLKDRHGNPKLSTIKALSDYLTRTPEV